MATKKLDRVDAGFLISLVESRPCLWDSNDEGHKDYLQRCATWREVCGIMNPKFYSLTKKDKDRYTKKIKRKWIKIRNEAIERDEMELKPYVYHKQLTFLKKDEPAGGDNEDSRGGEDSDSGSESDNSFEVKPAKRKRMNVMEPQAPPEPSSYVSFMLGLLPALNNLDDDETLEFQMGVIKALQDIRVRGESFSYI